MSEVRRRISFTNIKNCDNLILVQEDLAKMGVMIRHYNKKELKGYVRVSVGKPEHTDALMKCLTRLS